MKCRFINLLVGLLILSFASSVQAQKLNQVLNENEDTFKAYFEKGKVDPIEGVNKNFNGSYYRLGIKKMGDLYYAIVLESYDKTKWKPCVAL